MIRRSLVSFVQGSSRGYAAASLVEPQRLVVGRVQLSSSHAASFSTEPLSPPKHAAPTQSPQQQQQQQQQSPMASSKPKSSATTSPINIRAYQQWLKQQAAVWSPETQQAALDNLAFWHKYSNPTAVAVACDLTNRLMLQQKGVSVKTAETTIRSWHFVVSQQQKSRGSNRHWQQRLRQQRRQQQQNGSARVRVVHEQKSSQDNNNTMMIDGIGIPSPRQMAATVATWPAVNPSIWGMLCKNLSWEAKQQLSDQDSQVAEEIFLQHLLPLADLERDDTDAHQKQRHLVDTFNGILSAWATCRRPDRATALWRKVIGEPRSDDSASSSSSLRPDLVSFHCLMAASAQVGDGETTQQMLEDLLHPDNLWRPDIVSWNTTLSAWSESTADDATQRMDELLQRMIKMAHPLPNIKSYNLVLRAHAVRGQLKRCHEIWHSMKAQGVQPDWFTCGSMVTVYCRAGRADAAEAIWMQALSSHMQTHRSAALPHSCKSVLEDVLESIALSGDVVGTRRVLEHMEDLYRKGSLYRSPTTRNCNTLINAIFFSKTLSIEEATSQAEEVLQIMKNDQLHKAPNLMTYSRVLQLHLRSTGGFDRAVELARETFQGIRRNQFDGTLMLKDLKAIVLEFCKAGSPERAEEFLLLTCELAEQGRVDKPDLGMFYVVLKAWERSGHLQAAVRAEQLVDTLTELNSHGLVKAGPGTPKPPAHELTPLWPA